jgi:hypothetical protein
MTFTYFCSIHWFVKNYHDIGDLICVGSRENGWTIVPTNPFPGFGPEIEPPIFLETTFGVVHPSLWGGWVLCWYENHVEEAFIFWFGLFFTDCDLGTSSFVLPSPVRTTVGPLRLYLCVQSGLRELVTT